MTESRAKAFWVLCGPALTCGARALEGEPLGPAAPGMIWLDVCILGQHLPQGYRTQEAHELTAADCPRLGLCPDCLGFGDTGPAGALPGSTVPPGLPWLARGIDEVRRCPGCDGSGRPALRITHSRAAGSAEVRPLPHAYVPPLPGADPAGLAIFEIPDGMCLACGMRVHGR